MTRAVCPGSFDPVTNGHLDIFRRAAAIFDELVIATGTNPSKSRLFDPEERMEMLRAVCEEMPNVRVMGFTGLIVDFCREIGAQAIVKGLRGGNDYEYELPMAQMNAHLTGVETLFVTADPQLGFVSSSLVKEVAAFGGDVSRLVPDFVLGPLAERLAVVTISEFGRRTKENANYGLDHGHGNVMFLLGAGVKGGKYYGTWPGLTNTGDADLLVTTDYRSVLGEVVTQRLGASSAHVFPGFSPAPVGALLST